MRKAYPDAWEFDIGLEGATIDERLLAGQGTDVNAISGKIQPATLARIQTPELQERAISADASASPTWAWTRRKPRSTSSKCARR